MCDHYTRVTVSGSLLPSHAPTIGLLFGTKDGKNISICDATEAVYKYVNGNVNLMSQFIQKKKQLWTAVYTTQELIGWYYVGTSIESLHVQLHREVIWIFFFPNPLQDSCPCQRRHVTVSSYESRC